MQSKLTLNLDHLSVESFEAGKPIVSAPEHLTTCLETNCGKILCCA